MKTDIKQLLLLAALLHGLLTLGQNNLPVDMVLIPGTSEMEAFYLSATEVSIQDYQTFCKNTGRHMPPEPDWGFGDPKRPVVNVNYYDALAYCEWMANHHQLPISLPSKEQWQTAAQLGIARYSSAPEKTVVYLANSKEKPNCTTCMPADKLGVYALLGNVWEITLLDPHSPWGPSVMGGGFLDDADHVTPTSAKMFPKSFRRQDVGFRVMVPAVPFEAYLEQVKKGKH